MPDSHEPPIASDRAPDEVAKLQAEVEELRAQLQAAQVSEESKTQFLATTSHELKTPLAVIRGYAEMLRRGSFPTPEGQDRALETIVTRTDQLAGIIDRLLLASRVERGRAVVSIEPFDLVALVRDRVAAIRRTAAREVLLEVGDGIGLALGDVDAVGIVLDHLVDNAVKYSAGDSRIRVRVLAENHDVALTVEDQGIGMDEITAEHCFDRFWQADQSEIRQFGGTGIGLFLVKSLVEGMGGSVDVESEPGRGSTFTIRLSAAVDLNGAPVGMFEPSPAVTAERLGEVARFEPQASGPEEQGHRTDHVRARQRPLLVVEDETDLRLLVRRILEREGFDVEEAVSGRAALSALADREPPAAVLLDLRLPDMDGYEVLDEIRRQHDTADLPVILCTVRSRPEERVRGWRLGCDGYITKPFDPSEVVEEVGAVLARGSEERAAVRAAGLWRAVHEAQATR